MAEKTDSYDLQALHLFPCCSCFLMSLPFYKTVIVKMMNVL